MFYTRGLAGSHRGMQTAAKPPQLSSRSWGPSRIQRPRPSSWGAYPHASRTTQQQVQVTAPVYSDHQGESGMSHEPQRVFVFDPSNPERMEELLVQPHEDTAVADELLQAAQEELHAIEAVQNNGSSKRTPIPLRSITPLPARRAVSPLANRRAAVPGPMQRTSAGATAPAGLEVSKHVQQYEVMYREWRMKAEQLDADISMLQRLVAEKDAELAHGYKLLEASAAERSKLRHAYQASQQQAKDLQLQLAETQSQMQLTQGAEPRLLGSSSSSGGGASSGGQSSGKKAQVQSIIEELTVMARVLARDMSDELRSITSRSNSPERQDSYE